MANLLIKMMRPSVVVISLGLSLAVSFAQCDRERRSNTNVPQASPSASPSPKKEECDFTEFSPMKARANYGSPLISLPRPEYPAEAKEPGLEGEVAVRLLVNVRTGLVEKACVITGNEVFAPAAIEAGMRAKFDPYSNYIQQKFAYAEEVVKYQFSKP